MIKKVLNFNYIKLKKVEFLINQIIKNQILANKI